MEKRHDQKRGGHGRIRLTLTADVTMKKQAARSREREVASGRAQNIKIAGVMMKKKRS